MNKSNPRYILASNNSKKLAELQALLLPLGLEVVTQGSLGVPEVEEPYGTFLENALHKARHASAHAGLPAIADDSGLCVDALDGGPGVYSARYAALNGREKSDAANNELLLEKMQGVQDRRARFVCVLVFVRHAKDPEPVVAMGRWEGSIAHAAQGKGGFGYDPLFYLEAWGCTAAELALERKHAISHRGQAVADLFKQIGLALSP
jgi:XTP/dITP diphosphohydrolase